MSKHLGTLSRRMVLAGLLASSLATAAFAFNATVYAKSPRCCLLIANCVGEGCSDSEDCDFGHGFCCSECED